MVKKLHRKELQQGMNSVEWGAKCPKFLPENLQADLLRPEAIKKCMPHNVSPDLEKFVCQEARKIFAILLYIKYQDSDLHGALKLCQRYGLADDKLPIPENKPPNECLHESFHEGHEGQACQHGSHLNVFHHEGLGTEAWEDFRDQQWRFTVPVFEFGKFEYNLDFGTILPIVKYGEGKGDGHFGSVREAFIHPHHLNGFPQVGSMITSRERQPHRVAIKTFLDLEPRTTRKLKAQVAWTTEKDNLAKMQRHQHLIGRVAAVELGDQYLLISEWAEGGDLEKFWKENHSMKSDARLVWDVLVQFQGLADALNSLHDPKDWAIEAGEDDVNFASSSLGPKVPRIELPDDKPNWRHGDLKPANILIFPNQASRLGLLKIADLGLAKQHPVATGLRRTPSSMEYGTQAYEPPEVFTKGTEPRSRRYDIWSFGCIMLEMIVWLLYGHDGLQKLWNIPVKYKWQTLYYTVVNQTTAEVNTSILEVMDNILRHDPECNGSQDSLLCDLLLLVKDKLLVVALPIKDTKPSGHERIDAESLSKELRRLKKKAETHGLPDGNNYLWTGRGRSEARFRPPATTQQYLSPEPRTEVGRDRALFPEHTDRTNNQYPDLTPLHLSNQNQRETYTHEPVDPKEWTFTLDNSFAAEAAEDMMAVSDMLCNHQGSSLCQDCLNMAEDVFSKRTVSLAALRLASSHCDLCRLIAHTLSSKFPKWSDEQAQKDVLLFRIGSRIVFEPRYEGCGALSIGRMPGHGPDLSHVNFQTSFPRLAKAGSAAHAALLQRWLRDCDGNHGDCWRPARETHLRLPTRLVEVGTDFSPRVRLVESTSLQQSQQDMKFAALSYPWGDSKFHRHYSTTTDNYEQHKSEITMEVLPALLQDAIRVARLIGIGYLWIDALCIKQGPGGDFTYEAERMEDVFSAAYCVLAASRANGVSDSFLGERDERQMVAIPGSSLFVSEDIDDFQQHVIDGHLNKRGWVLQERALARRTIYFAEKQTYWECGRGIRCETFTKMSNKQAAFLGDSDFPRMAKRDTKGGRIRLFESLYEQYSRLHFTNDRDKSIAIAGLERRLCRAFDTDGSFGLFDRYFERSLLWQRASSEVESLNRISFPPEQEYVPSWSWMAYQGGIRFLDLPFDGIEWMKTEYRSPWAMNAATRSQNRRSVRDHSTSTLGVIARDFVLDSDVPEGAQTGLVWDGGAAIDGSLKCAAIGKLRVEEGLLTQRHYVLILKQSDRGDVLERVGVGCLGKDQIEFGGTQRAQPWSLVR